MPIQYDEINRRRRIAERFDHDIEQHGDRLIGTAVALSSAIEWLKTLRVSAAKARRS
jgi:hypothetical protein